MIGVRQVWVLCLLSAAGATWAADGETEPPRSGEPLVSNASPDPTSKDYPQLVLLSKAIDEMNAGRRQEAIAIADQVIAHYRAAYADERRDIYSAREAAEALAYMAKSVDAQRDAVVVSHAWGDAYALKGFSLVELGRVKEARAAIDAALALSPLNSQYLSELGYLHLLESRPADALEVYKRATEGAESVAPRGYEKRQLGVALRGQGYSLIELGRLDEAEAVLRKCLELDADDAKARNELRYIESLRRKQASESK
jgi:Flp pilus assembly protein TadD